MGNGAVAEEAVEFAPVDPVLRRAMLDGLVWLPELGVGFSGSALRAPSIYDEEYWRNYEQRARDPMAAPLNRGRVDLVNRHVGSAAPVVDIGIGAGTFIETRGARTFGYDVNPVGVDWLQARGLWCDPYEGPVPHACFWDALEHVHDPAALLANVQGHVFVSLPVFHDARDVLASKHYKPLEHIWYWTRDGLIRWMAEQGFEVLEHGTPESILGREAIHSFVFRRFA